MSTFTHSLLDFQEERQKLQSDTSQSKPERQNPCYACGVCCQHFRISFYSGELTGETGGWVPVELTTQIGPLRACMKGTEKGSGRCIGLRGDIGDPSIRCGVYEQRPSVCREFQAYDAHGTPNPDCQRLRLAAGLPPLDDIPPNDNDIAA